MVSLAPYLLFVLVIGERLSQFIDVITIQCSFNESITNHC